LLTTRHNKTNVSTTKVLFEYLIEYASKKGNIKELEFEEQREEDDFSNEAKVCRKVNEQRESSSPDVFDGDNQAQMKEKKERRKKDKKKKDKKKRSKKRKDEDED